MHWMEKVAPERICVHVYKAKKGSSMDLEEDHILWMTEIIQDMKGSPSSYLKKLITWSFQPKPNMAWFVVLKSPWAAHAPALAQPSPPSTVPHCLNNMASTRKAIWRSIFLAMETLQQWKGSHEVGTSSARLMGHKSCRIALLLEG